MILNLYLYLLKNLNHHDILDNNDRLMLLYEYMLIKDIYIDDKQLFQVNIHNDDIHLPKNNLSKLK